MALNYAIKHALKNGKNGVKNGSKAVVNGNGNGNRVELDYLVKPRENSLKAHVDKHFENLKYTSSPIGRKGQSLNMRAFGLHERELDPLITNKELDMKWDEIMGAGTRVFDGEEYKYQPAGTKLTKPSNISPGGQRPLMTKAASLMKAGKQKVNVNRKKHYDYMKEEHPEWVEDYTAKNARATMLNKHEADRRIAQGEKVPAKPQYVSFEHDIAIRADNYWDYLGYKGANFPENTYVNLNPAARDFKDFVESNFYTRMKTRGNNWYLKTDKSNMRDIEVWEISTGKLLGTIKMPRGYNKGMGFPQSAKQEYTKILRENATGFSG